MCLSKSRGWLRCIHRRVFGWYFRCRAVLLRLRILARTTKSSSPHKQLQRSEEVIQVCKICRHKPEQLGRKVAKHSVDLDGTPKETRRAGISASTTSLRKPMKTICNAEKHEPSGKSVFLGQNKEAIRVPASECNASCRPLYLSTRKLR